MTADISQQPTYYLITRQVFGDGFTTVHEQPGYHISAQLAAYRAHHKIAGQVSCSTFWHNGGPSLRYEEPHENPELACTTTLEWRAA